MLAIAIFTEKFMGGFFLLVRIRTVTLSVTKGARGGAVGLGIAVQAGRSRVRFLIGSLGFFVDIILPAALWPWGRLSLLQK
jgi:hypothetical protein